MERISDMEPIELTRRNFLKALAASVFAAGVPLPIGLRRESLLFVSDAALPGGDGKSWGTAFRTLLMATNYIEPGGHIFVRGMRPAETIEGSPEPSRPINLWGNGGGITNMKEDLKFEGHTVLLHMVLDIRET